MSQNANMQINKSQNAKNVLSNLKKELKVRTDMELSKILEVQPNTISTWKKRDSLDYPLLISICSLYKIDLNSLFLGLKKPQKPDFPNSPLVTRENFYEYTTGKIDVSDLPQYKLPFTSNGGSMIFQVNTNSMYPGIEENTFAICEKIEVLDIKDNSIVIIISRKKGFFINRIKKLDASNFLLTSDNTSFKKQRIKLNRQFIDEVWKIKGYINYNLDSDKLQVMNKRIKHMEAILTNTKLTY